MTKKTFLLTCLLGFFSPVIQAHYGTTELVSVLTMEDGGKLPLRKKTNNNETENGEPPKRLLIPEVTLQGNTLHFITPGNGYTVRLVQSNNISYVVEITGNTLTIPTIFSGMYELQIVSGDIIFYTEVEL